MINITFRSKYLTPVVFLAVYMSSVFVFRYYGRASVIDLGSHNYFLSIFSLFLYVLIIAFIVGLILYLVDKKYQLKKVKNMLFIPALSFLIINIHSSILYFSDSGFAYQKKSFLAVWLVFNIAVIAIAMLTGHLLDWLKEKTAKNAVNIVRVITWIYIFLLFVIMSLFTMVFALFFSA